MHRLWHVSDTRHVMCQALSAKQSTEQPLQVYTMGTKGPLMKTCIHNYTDCIPVVQCCEFAHMRISGQACIPNGETSLLRKLLVACAAQMTSPEGVLPVS